MIKSAAFMSLLAVAVFCQEPPDSRGRDFWFCFLPNFHNDGVNSQQARQRDSVFIYVAADEPTIVTLQFTPYDGRPPQVIQEWIANPRDMLTIKMSFWGIELLGVNGGGAVIDPRNRHTQRPVPYSLHLTADNDVAVYALNRAETTSDAFLVLPTDALDKEYFVMSYNSDVYERNGSTPSQCAIVAVKDSTIVDFIRITAPLSDGNVNRVLLQKGEVYLIQSQTYSERFDLTGTHIKANHPIAVFGGHQRVRVPLSYRDNLTSRDCLIEQIPSVNTWGRTALVVPYPDPADDLHLAPDRYRILAARDSTVIYRDSVLLTVLNEGQFYEDDLDGPHVIHANRPILVAQFRRTANISGDFRLGDPFMMMIPPTEQFLSSYRFICPLAYEDSVLLSGSVVSVEIYKQHFVTVVAPAQWSSNVRLDGAPIPQNLFRPIPKSSYVYAWIPLSSGVHFISADTTFGIYVYGYGYADSYGYLGGMSFRRYDFSPPTLSTLPPCPPYRIVVYDTAEGDSKVDVVRVVEDSSVNIQWQIVRSTLLPVDSAEVFLWLRDPFEDGTVMLYAQDAEQFFTRRRIEVPGMTLRLRNDDQIIRFPGRYTYRSSTMRTSCFPVVLTNVGKHPITILNARCTHGTITGTIPTTVSPSDTLQLDVCYRTQQTQYINDTLWIETPCGTYAAATFEVEFIVDTLPPQSARFTHRCPLADTVIVQERGYTQSGIKTVVMLDSSNIVVKSQSVDSLLALSQVQQFIIAQRDWRLDGWYQLSVVDSAGNTTNIEGFFEGHTVMISNRDSLLPQQVFIGKSASFLCDTLEIYNYGRFPKTFERVVSQGVEVSVPPRFLPLIIAPGERVRIPLCALLPAYTSLSDNTYHDTVELVFGCWKRTMPVMVTVYQSSYTAVSSCGVLVRTVDTADVELGIKIEGMQLILHRASGWRMWLYSIAGRLLHQWNVASEDAAIDLSNIPIGAYHLVMLSPQGAVEHYNFLWLGQ